MPDSNSTARRLASASPLAAAAAAFGDLVDDVDQARADMSELAARAGVVPVRAHEEDDFDNPHFAVSGAPAMLCGLPVSVELDAERAGWAAAICRVCVTEARAMADSGDAAEPAVKGDRVVCADGSTRTVAGVMHSGAHTWIETEGGSAWRAERCELVDTSRVGEAKTAARHSAAVLRRPQAPTDAERTAAVRELGEALRYLAQADPAALAELHEEANRRIALEVPRLSVVPGDIVHAYGARLTVLDTGVSSADEPQWWAKVHGVDQADRRATYRAPWQMGLSVECAAWDVVTVERIAPAPC
ncbi:hypothetical protein [Streptomyces sp. BH104]|uniref:hypothetical protein n=1 Tax=Streptomyces sp. BH104 TaxID=3410407 RepID=UPI003BB6C214